MGDVQHRAIIVTSWKKDHLEAAHVEANMRCPGLVSNLVEGRVNGYWSFFIAPAGSKLGWDEEEQAREEQEAFCVWLQDQCTLPFKPFEQYGGRLWLDWVIVSYPGDFDADILGHSKECAETRHRLDLSHVTRQQRRVRDEKEHQ